MSYAAQPPVVQPQVDNNFATIGSDAIALVVIDFIC